MTVPAAKSKEDMDESYKNWTELRV